MSEIPFLDSWLTSCQASNEATLRAFRNADRFTTFKIFRFFWKFVLAGAESGTYFAVGCLRTRRRDRFSRTAQAVEVEFNGVVHFAFDTVSRLARGDTAGEIGRIGGIAGRSFFNDDQVPAHFNPACLRILFCVPGARSSLGFPAIVTTPFF